MGTLSGVTSIIGNVNVPTGSSITGTDTGSVYAPGSVVQVKNAFTNQTYTTTSTTFQMTLSVTFDNPITSGNKVFVMSSFTASRGTFNSNWGGRVTIYRNSTNLGADFNLPNNSAGGIASSDLAGTALQTIHIIDTPDTTTPTYYLAHAEMLTGSTTVQIGGNRSTTSYGNTGTMITIMEIAQ